jgi:hypothetical protein
VHDVPRDRPRGFDSLNADGREGGHARSRVGARSRSRGCRARRRSATTTS